jgi:cysteine desulfurase/selenocysteine lyase
VEKQGGIVLFNSKALEPHQLALTLFELNNIAVRSGMHCAEPLISKLNEKGLCRASFYFYNTEQEVDVFVETLKSIISTFG